MESVRKDVECAFGRLKNRFRCLKIPSRFQQQEVVANQFRACVCLYNMCHDWDGLGSRWSSSLELQSELDGDIASEDKLDCPGSSVLAELRKRYRVLIKKLGADITGSFDASGAGTAEAITYSRDGEAVTETEAGWHLLRAKLVDHFAYGAKRKLFTWLGS